MLNLGLKPIRGTCLKYSKCFSPHTAWKFYPSENFAKYVVY